MKAIPPACPDPIPMPVEFVVGVIVSVPVPVRSPPRLTSVSVAMVRLFAPNDIAFASVMTPLSVRKVTLSVQAVTVTLIAPVAVAEPKLSAPQPSLIIAYSAALN